MFFIAGFEPFTLNDYPDKAASIIFLAGCNLRCRYCHNPELVLPYPLKNRFNEVKTFLEEKNIENIVITGGEPLFYEQIEELLVWLKSYNLSIKLDTNASFPNRLKNILNKNLIDFVAIDIKALNDEDLLSITRVPFQFSKVLKTIQIVNESRIPYELRYTKWKNYSKDEWNNFYKISNSKTEIKKQEIRFNDKILDKSFSF
jgi:pyruvate formate lyase activating enzyme